MRHTHNGKRAGNTLAALDTTPVAPQAELETKHDEAATRAGRDGDGRGYGAIVPVPRGGALVCTLQQEGLWFEHQLNPLSAAYHIAFALRLTGPLDTTALQRALRALVVRHEALRTRFTDHGGLPRQVIDPPPPGFPLPVTDITPAQVQAWAAGQADAPMDLAHGPLVRAALARTGPRQHVLVLVVHHIVGDGWSARIIVDELSQLYTGRTTSTAAGTASTDAGTGSTGGSGVLAPLAIQPADHAAWQRRWLAGPELERQLGFWRENLAGLPTVDFPADRPRPAQPTGKGATALRRLNDEIGAAARDYARTSQVSFLAVLQAALLTVLHRWTGQTDLPIGSVFSGRTRAETEPLVGYFVNTLVLRTRLDGDPTFADLVRRCHDTVVDATFHQDVPIGLVVEALQPDRVAGRHPLFQISLTWQPSGAGFSDVRLGHLGAAASPLSSGYAMFDVEIEIAEMRGGRLQIRTDYSTELFDAGRIERLLDHFTAALAGGLADPGRPAADIELMSAAERKRAMHTGNPPRTGRVPDLLHQVTAGHDPESTAIRFRGRKRAEEVTYGELELRANRLARMLQQAGVTTGDVVALLLDRGPHLLVAQLAVMKAGAVWMPMDPQNPPARLAFQIRDAAARLVLTTTDLADLAGEAGQAPHSAPRWLLDDPRCQADLALQPGTAPDGGVRPADAAYLIYTSGSTGIPKGVLVSHGSAYGYCQNAVQMFGSTAADRVPQVANTTFDVSIFDSFATLLAGATLISAPREVIADAGAFTALLREEQVTLAFIPPAILAVLDPEQLADSALRTVFAAGEALPAEQVNRWSRPGLELHNSYGPTEATVICTDYLCPATLDAPPPIGTALPDQRAYVLDACLRPVPIGVPGQLFIAGTGLAHGYLNRAALTAERFLADPFSDRPGERMYATGDLARRRPDGTLDYLGRTDRQVKLNGQRVELGEIEHALTQHPAVRQASVQVHDKTQLTAYLVPSLGAIDPGDMHKFLADRLPIYMIPARYLTIRELPLTPSGKLDTAALPDPTPQAVGYAVPRTDTERWLAAAWAEVLGTDQPIGATDNFFELGGNSLQATQLIARIRDRFHIQLHPRHLFTSRVLEQLAAHLDNAAAQRETQPSPELDDDIAELERLLAEKRAAKAKRTGQRRIVPVPRGGALVCTLQQEGLWFEHQLSPLSATYHIAFALRLTGPLDTTALQRALRALVVRHEALRTRFTDHGGLPRQVIDPPPPGFPLPVTDITPAQVQAWAHEQIDPPMDLARGPLVRAALARTGPRQHVLVLVVHHIVGDGWSARIIAGELSQLYTADTAGIAVPLAPLAIQPADHAAWQRRWLEGAELDRQLGFWRENLAGLPTVDFPADRPRPAQPTGKGATVERRLPDEIGALTHGYTRTHQVSFLAVLQAALLTVLHRWTGQTDLPIGSVFSGRTRAETEPVVGYFVNNVVLRTRLDGNPSFAELVGRCHETVLNATAHQDVPFGLVVDALQADRVTGRNPLFQINLSLFPPGASLGGLELNGITAEPVPLNFATSHIDMAIGITHAPDGTLDGAVEYSTELFDADRIKRLMDHFTAALAGGLADPGRAASDIELMSAAERDQVLYACNQTTAGYPPALLHHLAEAAAATTPKAVAVIDHDGTRHTYRELDTAANQLAHRLRRHGVGPATLVGVCLHRGMDLVTALLATWKAGGAYLPLDPDLPPDRLSYLITDASPAVIISATTTGHALLDHALTASPGQADATVIEIDAERDALGREPAGPPAGPDRLAGLDDPAYVLYTSGSTGTPKGVMVSHRGIHNRIAWMQDACPIGATDRVLQKTPYSFDVSVWEFFWPLTTGATLVLAAPGGHRDPHYLHQLITGEAITTMHFVPTMLNTFLDAITPRYPVPGSLARLRQVFCSGEALPAETVGRFLATWPGIGLHNLYGPTEASIDVTAWHCQPDPGPVPIGHPIANHRAYVLDACLRPVPIGVPGQLFIAGTGLAHGYLNRAALTAERFLADPFSDRPGERMYATGDLARRRPDGTLDYLGRTDRQVKLNGQRVELGEIEHALTQHPAVRQASVQVHRDTLTAYLAPSACAADIDETALREYLADRLPIYMIPARYLSIGELPLTPSGKLDTAALPDPTPQAAEYTAPRTPTERWLAGAWAELLNADRIGIHDNFFELGGNSLHATQLIARIAGHLHTQLHPRQLFTHPVLEHLATLIDHTASQPGGEAAGPAAGMLTGAGSDAGLVAFRSTGTRAPLFLVHPVGGSVTCYAQLAQALGGNQPVYGIEDPVLRGEPPADGLNGRAARYAELIRGHQPQGPYLLAGWSLGGWIAHEIARQLAAAGENTAVFALDTAPPPEPRTPTDLEVLAGFVIDLASVAGAPLPDIDLNTLGELNRGALEEMALGVLIDIGVATPDMRTDLRTRMRAFEGNYRAALNYQPGQFNGPMALITAGGNDATADTTGWAALAPALEHHTAGGDHYTMLRAPHLARLAAILRDALERATQRNPDPPSDRGGTPGGLDTAPGSSDTTAPQRRP